MQKRLFFLFLSIFISLFFSTSANADAVIIEDLSQHKNKKHNVLMNNSDGYHIQDSTLKQEDGSIQITLSLLDSNNNICEAFPEKASVYLWRPNGVEPDSMAYYSFVITHKDSKGNLIATYRSDNNTIQASPQYGLRVETNKPGIFEISYTVSPSIGPTWDELMDHLAATDKNSSFDHDGIRVSQNGNTTTFLGLKDNSRIRSDIELDSGLYDLPGNHFVFDNVQMQEVMIFAEENQNLTVHFTNTSSVLRGVEIWQHNDNSQVHLINDAIIQDANPHLSQRDYPLLVDINSSSSFLLTGKGSIPSDYCIWHTGTLDDVYYENKSACVNVFVQSDTAQDAIPLLNKAFQNIHLDHKQFPSKNLHNHIRTVLLYTHSEDFTREIVYEDHPAAKNMSEINSNSINLLLPDAYRDVDATLKVSVMDQRDEQHITYEIALIDSNNNSVNIDSGAYLYIPYPEGMNIDTATGYDFFITHYTAYGEEVFSSRNGTIILTPHGLRLLITSTSPYVLEWSQAKVTVDSLPHTGDHTNLLLYSMLAALSILILFSLCHTKKES